MKSTNSQLLVYTISMFILFSCDRKQCSTDNAIFLENEFESVTYQNEVAYQIETIGSDNLRFWLADYMEINNAPHFVLYAQGDDLCAKAIVSLDSNNPKLIMLSNSKGKGRFNAEFIDVQLKIETGSSGNKTIQWQSYATLID